MVYDYDVPQPLLEVGGRRHFAQLLRWAEVLARAKERAGHGIRVLFLIFWRWASGLLGVEG